MKLSTMGLLTGVLAGVVTFQVATAIAPPPPPVIIQQAPPVAVRNCPEVIAEPSPVQKAVAPAAPVPPVVAKTDLLIKMELYGPPIWKGTVQNTSGRNLSFASFVLNLHHHEPEPRHGRPVRSSSGLGGHHSMSSGSTDPTTSPPMAVAIPSPFGCYFTRGPLQIAGDAAHQVDAAGRQTSQHASPHGGGATSRKRPHAVP